MSLRIIPQTTQRLVSAAGTPERLLEAGMSFGAKIISVTIRALTTNAANIYLGNSPATALNTADVSYILGAGETLTLDIHDFLDGFMDLSDLWIDSTVNDDGVCLIWFEVLR